MAFRECRVWNAECGGVIEILIHHQGTDETVRVTRTRDGLDVPMKF